MKLTNLGQRIVIDNDINVLYCSQVSQWYDLVVFTASMEIYGAAVADKLDNGRNILRRRYYRQHCTPDYGSYTKDLTAICNDLNRVLIKFHSHDLLEFDE